MEFPTDLCVSSSKILSKYQLFNFANGLLGLDFPFEPSSLVEERKRQKKQTHYPIYQPKWILTLTKTWRQICGNCARFHTQLQNFTPLIQPNLWYLHRFHFLLENICVVTKKLVNFSLIAEAVQASRQTDDNQSDFLKRWANSVISN